MNSIQLLVADDKENILKLFEDFFVDGFDVVTVSDGNKALALALKGSFDVVVSDIRMPGLDGLALLRELKQGRPEVEVILMTAYASVSDAVEAMKQGAYDYLIKPFDPDEALLLIQRAAERKQLKEQAENLRSALRKAYSFEHLIGKSAVMQKVFELMDRAAHAHATVLITGESGTGKELVARAIHCAGPRKDRRFVAVNCGAIPENLIESELFGHKKGSFTGALTDRRGLFEKADGGTFFLDEVGELPLPLQVKLTRALQERAVRRIGESDERPVDVRILAATNIDLKEAVRGGRFREDLFYRLNIFPIRLPPLRQRREDIPLLAALFLERYGSRLQQPPAGFTPEALSALMRYGWPGNVRELENAIERALVVNDSARISLEALPEELARRGMSRSISTTTSLTYQEAVKLASDQASREYLTALLRETNGNVTVAAVRAGIERESLHRLLKRYGLRSEHFREANGEGKTV
jgi:DNA-binding NtrC family response regulator